MSIWRTCKHCSSRFVIELSGDDTDYNKDTTFCPNCNMNPAGDEKGKGIRKAK